MSTAVAQLSIFDTITIAVDDTPDVRRLGASADTVPTHDYTSVAGCPGWLTRDDWGALLAEAERAIRWNSCPRSSPNLETDPNGLVGGAGRWWYDGKGFREWGDPKRPQVTPPYVSWQKIRAALRHAREVEPVVARARDLAAAIYLLDYYQGCYLGANGEPGWAVGSSFSFTTESWCPDPLLDQLRSDIASCGGVVPADLLIRASLDAQAAA